MEGLAVRNLSFSYSDSPVRQLEDVSFDVPAGGFLTVLGPSGCGKSTLLRLCHPRLQPQGTGSGTLCWNGRPMEEMTAEEAADRIGFVGQFPDRQIVTDKVWHELAFTLENRGLPAEEIRARVAEIANYFGITEWFTRDTDSLSGGQKQILNLASAMVSAPQLLLLDEPTSQLDPIAAGEFLALLGRVHRELGVTVIAATQRPEDLISLSRQLMLMDSGRILACGSLPALSEAVGRLPERLMRCLPVPAQVFAACGAPGEACPWTVQDGRVWFGNAFRARTGPGAAHEQPAAAQWLVEPAGSRPAAEEAAGPYPAEAARPRSAESAGASDPEGGIGIDLREVFFRYEKESPDVLSGLSLQARGGRILAVLGGNGAGKSTLLSVIAGRIRPYRGSCRVSGRVGLLPQEPELLFAEKTVRGCLAAASKTGAGTASEREDRLRQTARLCRLEDLMDRHPFDLSGGERQRAALAVLLLSDPDILLLDEPTKGMDGAYREELTSLLKELAARGKLILTVSHDIEFCARTADRCGLLFSGAFASVEETRAFFCRQMIQTTAVHRMTSPLLADAVVAEDAVRALSGGGPAPGGPADDGTDGPPRGGAGSFGADGPVTDGPADRGADVPAAGLRSFGRLRAQAERTEGSRLRTLVSLAVILVLIPATLLLGMRGWGNRHYMLVSVLVVIEGLIPLYLRLERRGLKARELVLFSALIAIGVAGRALLFMLPEIKPVAAMTMISAAGFGGEAGFLIGSLTMLLSNMLFSQGLFTPWQMFAMGLLGMAAGALYRHVRAARRPAVYGAAGFVLVVGFYGVLMNLFTMLYMGLEMSPAAFWAFELTGLPLDVLHGAATFVFLQLGLTPFLEKFERLQTRYGFYGAGIPAAPAD